MRLEGKRAIITGAASGIGRAAAELFARLGASLVIADRDEAVHDTVDAIAEAGGRVRAIEGDVADEGVVVELVGTCVDAWGGVDVAFANAGITGGVAPVLELETADWLEVLRVNLLGAFLIVKHAGAHMVQCGGGSIICTASVAGLRGGAGPAHYSASKAGVVNLARTAAFQLGGTGVRVNAVCPGLIETGMTRPLFDAARSAGTEDKIGLLNPTRRAGRADEVAQLVAFLASDDASYVNGEAITVDGGLSASLPFVRGRMW